MAKNNFNSRKLVSFGDPSAAQGGWLWNIVAVIVVLLFWSYFSNWVPQSFNNAFRGPMQQLAPAENEMFWLPTPAEVWIKSVDLYQNGYRNAKDINPYPWIIDTYAE